PWTATTKNRAEYQEGTEVFRPFFLFLLSWTDATALLLVHMTISLRPPLPTDREFLFRLYASTREEEFSALGWSAAQLQTFLQMQFAAQQQWYATAYPGAEQQIVLLDAAPVGRMIVDTGENATTLVDICLLPAYRNRGIGGVLLRGLLERCGA